MERIEFFMRGNTPIASRQSDTHGGWHELDAEVLPDTRVSAGLLNLGNPERLDAGRFLRWLKGWWF